MRYLGWVVAVLLVSSMLIAQEPRSVSWTEVKAIQAQERSEFLAAQKEALAKLIEGQKQSMDALKAERTATQTFIVDLARLHSEERKEIMTAHSVERTELAKVHADERKRFSDKR